MAFFARILGIVILWNFCLGINAAAQSPDNLSDNLSANLPDQPAATVKAVILQLSLIHISEPTRPY